MTIDEQKLEILKKVENGILSVEEGSDLIGILENTEKLGQQTEKNESSTENVHETRGATSCWKAAWSMILVTGALLTAFSGYWMYQGYQKAGLGWGFWLSWIPLLIGILIMVIGWSLMDSPWMRIKVKSNEEGKAVNINLYVPIPVKLAKWVFQNFNQYMPVEVRDKGIPEMLDQIERSMRDGDPFIIQVDDEKDGSHVEISME